MIRAAGKIKGRMDVGDRHTEESKKKISISKTGRTQELSTRWKGENAGYQCKHKWLRKYYGSATKCEKCKTTTAKRYEWANISGLYKRDVTDYIQLCTSCHRKMDYAKSK